MDSPYLLDHFVACSYLSEKGLYSIFDENKIIFGFSVKDGGAIMAMGANDIDSIGSYSTEYNGSRILQEGNGPWARYYIPDEIVKYINKNGHNEIVIERRDNEILDNVGFKRKPDYIVMMTDGFDEENMVTLDELFNTNLYFISSEDRIVIRNLNNKNDIKEILLKYKYRIKPMASDRGYTTQEYYDILADYLMKIKYYDNSLKAASQFNIPLLIVDRVYYFNKMVDESFSYSDSEKTFIKDIFLSSNVYTKRDIFNDVAFGNDISKYFNDYIKHSTRS